MTNRKQNPGMPPPESPTLATRVPQEVADYLREQAKRERRTLSALLSIILEDYVAERQKAAQRKRPKS